MVHDRALSGMSNYQGKKVLACDFTTRYSASGNPNLDLS